MATSLNPIFQCDSVQNPTDSRRTKPRKNTHDRKRRMRASKRGKDWKIYLYREMSTQEKRIAGEKNFTQLTKGARGTEHMDIWILCIKNGYWFAKNWKTSTSIHFCVSWFEFFNFYFQHQPQASHGNEPLPAAAGLDPVFGANSEFVTPSR